MSARRPPLHAPIAFMTRAGGEAALIEELSHSSDLTEVALLQPQVVTGTLTSSSVETPLVAAFARQTVPNYEIVEGASISELSTAIFDRLISHFSDQPSPWIFHVIEPESSESGKVHNRAKLIRQGVAALLAKKRRSLNKSLTSELSGNGTIVQVLQLTPSKVMVSIVAGHSIFPVRQFAAGCAEIPDDKTPPSRAFKKLVEARAVWQLPFIRGQTAIDLGASPGGWSYVASKWGLKVTAVDRSPLASPVMRSRLIQFEKGDAFSWKPLQPVSWLLCDVISAPERTAQLIQEWVSNRWCTYFCVTMKFKGAPAVEEVVLLKKWLASHATWFDSSTLTNNKNEITWVGGTEPLPSSN